MFVTNHCLVDSEVAFGGGEVAQLIAHLTATR
jgi:hypothetical protein